MSAFLCSDKHLSVLADAVNTYLQDYWDNEVRTIAKLEPKEIFAGLKKLNIESVNYRYQQNTSTDIKEMIGFTPVSPFEYTQAAILKAAEYYLCQSCEIPDYQESHYFKCIKTLADHLRYKIIEKLPQYKNAAWHIE